MLTKEQKEQIARKGNEFLLREFSNFLQGYPEAEKVIGVKLNAQQKLDLLIDAFKTIIKKIKETDPTILSDPLIRVLFISSLQVPTVSMMYWQVALMKAEQG